MNGMEKKLFVGRNIDGEKDKSLFEVARKAESKLKVFPEFIAVSPFGSRVKGYADSSSDYDYWVYVDVEKEKKENGKEFLANLDTITKEYATLGIEVNFHIQGINMEDVFHGLAYGAEYLDPQAVGVIANLTRITTGVTINDYRKKVKHYLGLHSWTKEEIEELIRRVVSFLEKEDSVQNEKISQRVYDFDPEKYSQNRKSLWENRVEVYSL